MMFNNNKLTLLKLLSVMLMLLLMGQGATSVALAADPVNNPSQFFIGPLPPGCVALYRFQSTETWTFCANGIKVNTDTTNNVDLITLTQSNEFDSILLAAHTHATVIDLSSGTCASPTINKSNNLANDSNSSGTPSNGPNPPYTIGGNPATYYWDFDEQNYPGIMADYLHRQRVDCVNITYINQNPVASPNTASFTYTENDGTQAIDLNSYFSDFEGHAMTFSKNLGDTISPFAPVSITGGLLLIKVAPNGTGTGSVTITATDGPGGTGSGTMTINVTVTGVNDPPKLVAPMSDLTLSEDSTDFPINLNNVFSDETIPTFSVTSNTNPALVSTNISGFTLTLHLATNQSGGPVTIAVQADDGVNLPTSDSFNVTVSAVDDPPVLNTPVGNRTYQEDQLPATIGLGSLFSDVDTPLILYTVDTNANPTLMTAVVTNTNLTLTFLPNQAGSNSITLRGEANGVFIYHTFQVTVVSVDDAPTVANLIPAVYVNEDDPMYQIDLSQIFADIDSPTINKVVMTNTTSATISTVINGNMLNLTFAPNRYHNPIVTPTLMTTIVVRATGVNNSVIGTNKYTDTSFNVTIAPVDDPPIIFAPIANMLVSQNSSDKFIMLKDVFIDIDTPTNLVTYTVDANDNPSLVNVILLTATNQLQLVFTPNRFGQAYVTIGGFFPDQFDLTAPPKPIYDTFTVYVNRVDQGPIVLNPVMDLRLLEDAPDTLIDLTEVFSDLDTAIITKTVAVISNPQLVTATMEGSNILRLHYAPEANVIPYRAGVVNAAVVITGTAEGKTIRNNFTVYITPTDDLPSIAKPIDPVIVQEDAPNTVINLAALFSDPDQAQTTITKSVINDNPGLLTATVAANNLTLSYTPDMFGEANLTLIGHSNGLTVAMPVSVTVMSVDDPPYLKQPLADMSAMQDSLSTALVNLTDFFMDDDSPLDLMTYTVTANTNPDLVKITFSGNTMRLDYVTSQPYTTNIAIRAYSNGQYAEDSFILTIVPLGNLPPIVGDDFAETLQGQAVQINILENDSEPNGDVMQVQRLLSASHGLVGLNSDQTVTYTPTASFIGTDTFRYLLADNFGAVATATVTVNVLAPTVSNLTAQQVSNVPLQIQLSWDYPNITNLTHFELIMDSPTESITLTSHSYVDSRAVLTYNTTYHYQVRAWLDNGQSSAIAEVTVTPSQPVLATEAQGSGFFSGQVTAAMTPTNQPIEGAVVCLNWLGLADATTQICQLTDATGRFTVTNIATDTWYLTVTPPITGPFAEYLPSDTITINPTDPGPYELGLKRPNLKGRLILSNPVARATMPLDPYLKAASLRVIALDNQGELDLAAMWTATSDDLGAFKFGTLPIGQYELFVGDLPSDYLDYYPPAPVTFTITSDLETVDLNNILIPKAAKIIKGRVTLPNNSPAERVIIEAVKTDDGVTSVKSTVVDAQGNYSLLADTGSWELRPIAYEGEAPNWAYRGRPQPLKFEQPNTVAEAQTLNFPVVALDSVIKGQVLLPDGQPLTSADSGGAGATLTPNPSPTGRGAGGEGDKGAAMQLMNLESREVILQYLKPDGSFYVPVVAGDYELTMWLDEAVYPAVMAPQATRYLASPSETTPQSITLLARDGRIYGRVIDEQGEPARFITVTVWNLQNQWFTQQTDINGYYSLDMAADDWTVGVTPATPPTTPPDSGGAGGGYIYENDNIAVTLDKAAEKEVNLTVTRASRQLHGKFVNDGGKLVDTQAKAMLLRPARSRSIAVASTEFGQFTLPWPDNCNDCQVQVTLEAGAGQSLVSDNVATAAETVTFEVAVNSGVVQGQFLDPLNGQAMNNVKGEVSLTPQGAQAGRNAAQVATINPDGSYRFDQVGAGQYELSYSLFVQLNHQAFFTDPDNALSNKRFLKQPSKPFTVEVPPLTPPLNQGGTGGVVRDIVLETGNTFLVTVQGELNQAVTSYFPTAITCEYADKQTVTYSCDKACFGPSWMSVCATPNNSNLSLSLLGQANTLINTARPVVCTVQAGASLEAPEVAPPPVQAIQLNTSDLILVGRTRNLTIEGQVVAPDGQPMADSAVSIYSAGSDGQLYTTATDTQGQYQFKVSATQATWYLKATANYNGLLHTAEISLSQSSPGTVQAGLLQLVSTGQSGLSPLGLSFNESSGLSLGLPISPITPAPRNFPLEIGGARGGLRATNDSRTLQVNIPAGAMPTSGAEISLAINTVAVPNSGSAQVMGQGYSIQFVEGERNRRLLAPLRHPILVDLPYSQADLTALGLSASQLRAGYFSPQRNLWTPLPATVDEANQLLQLKLSQPVEAIAILAPTSNAGQFFNPFIVPISGVENVSPVAGVTISVLANTFRNQVMVEYKPSTPLSGIGLAYTLIATDTTGAAAQPRPSQPYTITVHLDPAVLATPGLGFYYHDETTGQWLYEPTTQIDMAQGTITATPTHFGEWMVSIAIKTAARIYLPLVVK